MTYEKVTTKLLLYQSYIQSDCSPLEARLYQTLPTADHLDGFPQLRLTSSHCIFRSL